MNYGACYASIVTKANKANRKKGDGSYYERHHIVPRAIGGSNERHNLVLLTAKEHFVAHHLLFKMWPGRIEVQRGFWMMCNAAYKNGLRLTASLYERMRTEIASNFRHTDEAKAKIRAASTGRKIPPESVAKAVANRDYTMASEACKRMNIAKRGTTHTEATKRRMSESAKGYVKSPEHRERLRQALLGKRRGHWFTDGVRNTIAVECPAGFMAGRTVTRGTS